MCENQNNVKFVIGVSKSDVSAFWELAVSFLSKHIRQMSELLPDGKVIWNLALG